MSGGIDPSVLTGGGAVPILEEMMYSWQPMVISQASRDRSTAAACA